MCYVLDAFTISKDFQFIPINVCLFGGIYTTIRFSFFLKEKKHTKWYLMPKGKQLLFLVCPEIS